MKYTIAILLTCFNRREKTIACLNSVYNQAIGPDIKLEVFLVDDGSTDGTSEAVKNNYPDVRVIQGNGSLYWAGGMRKAWTGAINSKIDIDFFLLLNDDTTLYENTISNILADLRKLETEKAILVAPTIGPSLNQVTYGGSRLLNANKSQFKMLTPNGIQPQICDLGNANIMLVPFAVYQETGILSESFTHGIADFDYTLSAKKKGILTYVTSDYGGVCHNDHGKNWRSGKEYNLKQRINYLYSPTGLAYKEYLYYIRKHFPKELPEAFLKIWTKTLFPYIYDKLK
jgi:GT2 family glycosyltransferase